MRPKLKIYVWTGFSPDYTGGLAIALAKSESDARAMVEKEHGYNPSDWGDLSVHSIAKPFAVTVSGGS